MPRTSTIKRLPPDIREAINGIIERGHTLDDIKRKLAELERGEDSCPDSFRCKPDVDKIAREMLESRQLAEALARNLADRPESWFTRLNIEMLESAVFALRNSGEFDLKQMVELSRVVKNLIAAKSANAALNRKLRDEGRKEAEAKIEAALSGAVGEAGKKALTPLQALERVKAIYRGEA